MQNPLPMKLVWIIFAVGNIYYMVRPDTSRFSRILHFISAALSVLYFLGLM